MDTVYYNFTARRVKVSGGPDLLRFVPAAAAAPAGEVLDFQRCRRRLETKQARKELERAVFAAPQEEAVPEAAFEEVAPSPRRERRERAAGYLELAASASVIAVSVAAILAFFIL